MEICCLPRGIGRGLDQSHSYRTSIHKRCWHQRQWLNPLPHNTTLWDDFITHYVIGFCKFFSIALKHIRPNVLNVLFKCQYLFELLVFLSIRSLFTLFERETEINRQLHLSSLLVLCSMGLQKLGCGKSRSGASDSIRTCMWATETSAPELLFASPGMY